jgi:hypothetical protein
MNASTTRHSVITTVHDLDLRSHEDCFLHCFLAEHTISTITRQFTQSATVHANSFLVACYIKYDRRASGYTKFMVNVIVLKSNGTLPTLLQDVLIEDILIFS